MKHTEISGAELVVGGSTPSIIVTSDTVEEHAKGLPFAARQALAFATRLQAGSLDVTLPDGRKLLFCGATAGPNAEIIVHDLAFARRFADGGDIGIAEAYLRGEWETPNLTRFLQLFCVNHELIAKMLEHRPLIRAWRQFQHWLNRNSRTRFLKRNIHAHYDSGTMPSTSNGSTGR